MKSMNISKVLSAIALAICGLSANAQTQNVAMQIPVPASATGVGGTTTVTVGGVTTTTATTNGVTATTISLPGTATGALTCSTGKETWTPFTDSMGNVFSPFTGCVSSELKIPSSQMVAPDGTTSFIYSDPVAAAPVIKTPKEGGPLRVSQGCPGWAGSGTVAGESVPPVISRVAHNDFYNPSGNYYYNVSWPGSNNVASVVFDVLQGCE